MVQPAHSFTSTSLQKQMQQAKLLAIAASRSSANDTRGYLQQRSNEKACKRISISWLHALAWCNAPKRRLPPDAVVIRSDRQQRNHAARDVV